LDLLALELVKKYDGVDRDGRLFPFISAQKYNEAIKEILTVCGITREVYIRNSATGEYELKNLNMIASSHIARKTFINSLYEKVQDPEIIGQISGHVEGSRAFARYRNISVDILRDAISKIAPKQDHS
jgi:integrase